MNARAGWNVQETKLIPPHRPGGLIERRRLHTSAVEGIEGRLLLVLGAAGFGKSSLLASLHAALVAEGRAVSWISLDEADNDHARFLSHWVQSFRAHDPRFGAGIATLLGSGAALPAATFRTGLLNELAALDRPVYVFLDDYHLISDADVRETVNAVLTAPLPRLHLAIATRTRNALPVSRLRSTGALREIEGPDLAFSEDETKAFLAMTCRRDLERSWITTLHDRTEGWAASVQLASIALDHVRDVPAFLRDFSGETRNVGEFLGDEVLRQQRPELQQFLLDLSVLRRFDLALATAMSQREDAGSLIREIVDRNLFILALDDRDRWFRFHHLFSDFLRGRLRARDPDRIVLLHRRATDALIQEGLSSEAIEHAFLGGDAAKAGRLLDETCGELFATGQVSTLQQHAARLTPAQLRELPRLQLELSWDHEIQWRFAEARTTLRNVTQVLHEPGESPVQLSDDQRAFLESKLLHRELMLEFFTDHWPESLVLGQRWREEHGVDDHFMQASVGTAMMLIDREHFDVEAAESKAEALRSRFIAGGAIYGTIFHDSVAATTLYMRGDVQTARRMMERARQTARDLAGVHATVTAMPTALLAELCYECDELPRARELLSEHAHYTAEFGFLDQTIARYTTASRLAFDRGRHDEAESALESGVFVATQMDFPRLLAHMVAERIRQLGLRGRPREAQAMLERPEVARFIAADPSPGDCPSVTDERWAAAWARVAILREDAASAVPVLRRWFAFLRPTRCHRAFVRTGALLAHAQAASGEANAALRTLRETLGVMQDHGFVRTIIDEGPLVMDLVGQLRGNLSESESSMRPLLDRILDRSDAGIELPAPIAKKPCNPCVSAEGVDGLSARELEIVRLSAEGMATADIARAAHLSENTVKWYWQRIFEKLDVHRRFDAIRLARKRHWLA